MAKNVIVLKKELKENVIKELENNKLQNRNIKYCKDFLKSYSIINYKLYIKLITSLRICYTVNSIILINQLKELKGGLI